jgi:SAM-dependent methyltransferase
MASPPRPGPVDWSVGRYEETAPVLRPAAAAVVAAATPRPGEHIIDVGTGTGTAALLVAQRGARVTGVDPAERLLAVAEAEAQAARLKTATFVPGSAAALPVPDDAADAVVSSFGVIFAPDAAAVAAEMDRVLRGYARIALSAWTPEGTIGAFARVGRTAVQEALGVPAGPPPFPWHERDALADLLAPYGFGDVRVREHTLAFTAPSPEAYLEGESASHPLWVAARPVLEAAGTLDTVRAEALAVLAAGNEDRRAFRVTSRYVVALARRGRHLPG